MTAGEWEQVRLHPYHTERVVSRSPFLAALAPIAGAHHERLDGSGYHRGCGGAELPLPARVLSAADTYHAMTEPRPHREPLAPDRAAELVGEEASAGRLDADAVAAVVEAAGQQARRIERPAGLTDREAEVLGMLARGLQTKQVARALGISVKTADHHVETPTGKSGSLRAPPRPCSRCSTAWPPGENSLWRAQRFTPSVLLGLASPPGASAAKEDNMATAMMVDNPEGSQEIYDRVREQLGLEKPAGGIFHVAGPSPNGGWRVIEVWDSEDDAKRFVNERMLPAFKAVGAPAPPPPQLWPVHNYMA